MNRIFSLAVVGLALAGASGPVRGQNAADPLAKHFYAPELVRLAHQALKLTGDQQGTLQEALEQAHSRTAQFQERMKGAQQKLEIMVKEDKLDEEAVLKQASRVLDLERDIKMTRLALLVKIKNTLTLEQQAKLKELKEKTAGFQAKVNQATDLARKWKEEGRDISQFEQARDQFEALMSEGDFPAAEALLDKTLKWLRETKKE